MRTRYLSLFSALILVFSTVNGQTKADIRDLFNQGETFILFEEYDDALQFYTDLNKLFPDNANYKYRIGQCYLNIPGEKEKAIPYLEEAVENISLKHRIGKLREKTAPYDALYYLANAYRINNQLEKAIETYESFMQNMDQKIYDSAVVNFQLQTCHNALNMMQTPLYVRDYNLGEDINDRYSETNPVVSTDGKGIFYTRVLPFRRALFYSELSGDRWSGPIDIVPQLNVDDKFYPTSVSTDGQTLYLYSDFDYDGNLYASRFEDGQWTKVERLNDNINTKYWESHATISPDGRRLYFSSNRKGGFGELDIYVSELDSTGNWGPAINLGPVINTEYHEDTPFLTDDGNTLFFSSRGHYNMGGFDIFYSTLFEDGTWSVPLNAGYPLNTTDDDLFFMPLGAGYEGFIARFDEEGYGLRDIYRVEIFSDDHPRKFLIRGISRIQDLRPDLAERIRIVVRGLNNPDPLVIVYSDLRTGKYEFEISHGDYEITFDADGTAREVKRLTLPLDHPADTVAIALTELEKTDFEADLRILSDSLITVRTGDSIEIRLFTEPRSILDVLVMNEGNVIASDRFLTVDTTFTYRFLPQPGINVIDFRLTDIFSNIATARVVVEWQKDEPIKTVARPEYTRVIADRQVSAFLDIMKQDADDDLRKVISLI
ncbi:MAG: tetratricopeptide repeat protein, partial [Bacteroidales bacterium]|nr:tetratricopeptide repeat protein [Bacteroidales bacterium]